MSDGRRTAATMGHAVGIAIGDVVFAGGGEAVGDHLTQEGHQTTYDDAEQFLEFVVQANP